jgi:hypothetical protein
MPPTWIRGSAAATLLVVAAHSVSGQDTASGKSAVPEVWNFAVPETPATSYLEAGAATVVRPLTARDLAAELINTIDSSGGVRQGIALAVTPSYLLRRRVSLDRYRKSPGAYAYANTQVSLATVRTAGGDGSTDLALGLRTVFFDKSDPMRDPGFALRLDSIMATCEPGDSTPPISGNVATPEARAMAAQAFEDCAQQPASKALAGFLAQHWNASGFGVGAASGLRFRDSKVGESKWSGLAAWAAGSLQLGASGLIVAQLQIDHREPVAGAGSTTLLKHGARLLFGSPKANLFAEVTSNTRISGPEGQADGGQWTGGLEFKAGDNLWLSTGFGSQFAPDQADRVVLLANVRWVIAKNSRFSPVPRNEDN